MSRLPVLPIVTLKYNNLDIIGRLAKNLDRKVKMITLCNKWIKKGLPQF